MPFSQRFGLVNFIVGVALITSEGPDVSRWLGVVSLVCGLIGFLFAPRPSGAASK